MLSVRIRPGLPERKRKMMSKSKILQAKAKKKTSSNFQGFLIETRKELSRVEWPNRKSVFVSSWVIVVLVVFFTSIVAVFDGAYSKIFIVLRGF